MTVIRFSPKDQGDTLLYRLPSWATKKDKFCFYSICDIPENSAPSRCLIIHCGEYSDPFALYAIKVAGKVKVRYIDQPSPRTYRLRLLHEGGVEETLSVDEVKILGRIIEVWLDLEGRRKWVFTDGEQVEPARLEELGILLKTTVK